MRSQVQLGNEEVLWPGVVELLLLTPPPDFPSKVGLIPKLCRFSTERLGLLLLLQMLACYGDLIR